MTTELTLPQRAAVALGTAEHEKQLALLVEESKTITEIKNKDGREQCHSAYMKLKNARVTIKAVGKAAREDATAFSNAVIAEEKRLVAITEAEEARLQGLRDAWDAAIEAERQAKIEAERQRIACIRSKIAGIANATNSIIGKTSAEISARLEALKSSVPTAEEFAEFFEEAVATHTDSISKMEVVLQGTIQQEAEAVRLKAEREELARLRAEAEARRKEDERIATEKRAAEEVALQAERDRLAAERAEIERQQADLAEAKRKADEDEAERIRLQAASDQALADAREPAVTFEQVMHAVLPTELAEVIAPIPTIPPSADTGARIKLGEISTRLGFTVTADFLFSIGFSPVATDKSAKLYRLCDFPAICAAIISHIQAVAQEPAKAA